MIALKMIYFQSNQKTSIVNSLNGFPEVSKT